MLYVFMSLLIGGKTLGFSHAMSLFIGGAATTPRKDTLNTKRKCAPNGEGQSFKTVFFTPPITATQTHNKSVQAPNKNGRHLQYKRTKHLAFSFEKA